MNAGGYGANVMSAFRDGEQGTPFLSRDGDAKRLKLGKMTSAHSTNRHSPIHKKPTTSHLHQPTRCSRIDLCTLLPSLHAGVMDRVYTGFQVASGCCSGAVAFRM